MPGGDRTGPTGQGPRSGRAAGYCSGYSVPGFMNPPAGGGVGGRGRGGRGGRGGGRGWRNMFYATGLTGWQRAAGVAPAPAPAPPVPPQPAPVGLTEEQELAALQAQADEAAATLDQIRRRIDEIAAARMQPTTDE